MKKNMYSSWPLWLMVAGCLEAPAPESPPESPPEECPVERRAWWEFGLPDPVLDEVALYYLGQTWHQAADAAEVLETIGRVEEGPRGWFDAWMVTADRLTALGEASEAAGHPLTAAESYLRAATYLRAALHRHPDPYDPEVAAIAADVADLYGRHLLLSASPCERVEIPYESTSLPGYFCRAPSPGIHPTILFHEGKDGWAQDGKYIVDEAQKRDYNVLLFDGPGIGETIRREGLPFRPDWEVVVTQVVDFAIARPETDPDRIALFAVSLGGYLAPRAAAFEHRLKALVANPGVTDWGAVYEDQIAQIDPSLLDLLETDPAAFDTTITEIMSQSDFLSWGMTDSMWHFGATTPSGLLQEVRRYDLGELAAQITAHTLVIDAEAETRGQSRALYDAITAPKTLITFTEEEAAQFHVQPGATAILSLRVFEWLEDTL